VISKPEGAIPPDSSEEYWGLDLMDEDADPDFEESIEEDESSGGW
jgi:hypothetical protein